ncbi:MAG: fumarate hydratase, partial [Proteobacteria bacterium]|nr:fumarate hydratase [Pseudomonadota bacterium]
MTRITTDDITVSIADALQYISYYHPPDFIEAMARAYEHEASESAKNAIGQILINSRMAAQGRRPVCQDTGVVVAFVKIGQSVLIEGKLTLQQAIDEGVRRAYTDPENPLRDSLVSP